MASNVHRPRIAKIAAALVGLSLVLSACGGTGSGENAEATQVGSTEEAAGPSVPLTGEFTTIDGATIDLGSLEGRDVVLWFWAPW